MAEARRQRPAITDGEGNGRVARARTDSTVEQEVSGVRAGGVTERTSVMVEQTSSEELMRHPGAA